MEVVAYVMFGIGFIATASVVLYFLFKNKRSK